MIGISAASRLTLTLITQDEMNQRTASALNTLETAARLYQSGLTEAEIRRIVPADPVVDSLTIAPSTPTIAGLGTIQAATVSVTYHPAPADQTWTGHLWTGGNRTATRTSSVTVCRSGLSATVN